MEEIHTNSDDQRTEVETSQENKPQGTPMRSCILMLLAGAYLVYTGFRLCKNVIDGVEGGSWGFFAAGVGFLIVGVVMLIVGGKNFIKNDKEKKAMEAAAAEKTEAEKPEEKKTMSIAERANLASNLGDTVDVENTDGSDSAEKAE